MSRRSLARGVAIALCILIYTAVAISLGMSIQGAWNSQHPTGTLTASPTPTPDEVVIPVFERPTPPPNTPPGQGNWKYSWAYVKGHWCQVPTDGVTWDNVVGRQQCPHS